MALSKSTRIKIMLGICTTFFLVELISGFIVHSLALMADAFHMLNDIISLLVGLWAVNLAQKGSTDRYSFGWLRAEILGAFFNAVFLIALCVSIVLEAVTRLFDPPEISNPQIILIVGCFGLASNLVGFVVLGGHGHSHGHGDSHDHAHAHGTEGPHSHDELHDAEQGRAGNHDGDGGPILEVLPEVNVSKFKHSSASVASKRISFDEASQTPDKTTSHPANRERTRRRGSHGRNNLTSIDDMSIYPSAFRSNIIAATRHPLPEESSSESEDGDGRVFVDESVSTETTPLLSQAGDMVKDNGKQADATFRRHRRDSSLHHTHNHNKPRDEGSSAHGHNHGDMGMNAMILHVLGDALGNVGVIVTALIIWLTDWPGKYYADPAVSLFITIIILRSALPLTFATSKILLQATPDNIVVQDVKADINSLPGVLRCHHVHIWQLSDTKIIASMHIRVAFTLSEASGERYMILSKRIRKCLHGFGIHSATIQPEFDWDDTMQLHGGDVDGPASANGDDVCLLECVDDCVDQGCCSTTTTAASESGSHADHDHGHDEDGHHHH